MLAKYAITIILVIATVLFALLCYKIRPTEISSDDITTIKIEGLSEWTEDDFEEYRKLNQATIDAVNKMNSASEK